jgi:WD40 repeat protein
MIGVVYSYSHCIFFSFPFAFSSLKQNLEGVNNLSVLSCFSADGKYLLSGGEDDLVQVWSMDDRKMVAWGEGHTSWVILSLPLSLFTSYFVETCYFDVNLFSGPQVSSVAFDSYWSPPNSDEAVESVMYRFGSVGQVPISLYKTTNLLICSIICFFSN